jgi:hypothetical protein
MANVTLRREVEAYDDLLNQYRRDVRGYRSDVAKHNAAVDAYNNALKTGMEKYNKTNTPIEYYGYVGMGSRIEKYYDKNDFYSGYTPEQIKKNNWTVARTPSGGSYYIYKNLPTAPGQFTQKAPEQPEKFGGMTAAQQKSLYAPSLAAQEGGLISDVIRSGGVK